MYERRRKKEEGRWRKEGRNKTLIGYWDPFVSSNFLGEGKVSEPSLSFQKKLWRRLRLWLASQSI